jgi:hypothetical protein
MLSGETPVLALALAFLSVIPSGNLLLLPSLPGAPFMARPHRDMSGIEGADLAIATALP